MYNGISDYVEIANSNSISPTGAITVEYWTYPIQFIGARYQEIVRKSGDYLTGVNPSNNFFFTINNFAKGSVTYVVPSLNQWYDVVGTYDSINMKLYVNGILQSTVPYTSAIGQSGATLKIGTDSTNSEYFNGTIDDVHIYNRSLSASEIQAQYYTHLQQLQVKATGNGTASGNWNGTGSNPLTVPVGSTDTITGLSYSIPSSVVVNGITVNNYNNATKWNLTATANYTIGTGNVQIWGTNVSTAQANVTVTYAPNNITIST